MKNLLKLVLCGAVLLAAGCSTLPKSDLAALQGTWNGRVVQDNQNHLCRFIISGSNFDFRGDDTNVWDKGTFVLRADTTPKQYIATIGESAFPQYVGKTSMAIYQLVNGTLTITGNEPGNPAVPATFDAPGAARLEVKRP